MSLDAAELFNDDSKSKFYIDNNKTRWDMIYKSIQVLIANNNMAGKKVLEIGCAAGGLYEVLKEKYSSVDYTGMDISSREIEHAKKTYPHANFINADFLSNKFKPGEFDTVCAFQIINHMPEYKKFISELLRVSNRCVLFDARVQYDYPSIVDLETSYVYYHESGKRNYFIGFNFYEIYNYLHLEELNIKKITVQGYWTPVKTTAFVPFPKSKLIAASFCLEKYATGEKVKRCGGRPEFISRDWCETNIQMPDFSPNYI